MRFTAAGEALDRIVPAFVLVYAVWTIHVHAIVALQASFDTLMKSLPVLLAIATATTLGWSRLRQPSALAGAEEAPRPGRAAFAIPWIAMALAGAWVTALLAGMPYAVFWWGGLAGLGLAWAWQIRAAPASRPAAMHGQRHAAWVLATVVAAAIAVVLFVVRPDADDAFHLSIPATLLRHPDWAVLLHDTMYRLPEAPILTPFYRLNNYDVLVAVVARASGLDHLLVAYLILPSTFAALSVMAWGFLLRRLAPARWVPLLPILFACVMAFGEVHRAYGNFAFVRLFQGKAVLATCLVPAITGAALLYVRHGGLRYWLVLFASQVAALGFAASSLFVAPAAAALGLAGGWTPTRTGTHRMALGLLASAYLAVAAWLVSSGARGERVLSVASATPMPEVPAILVSTWGAWGTPLLLVAMLAAWAFVRDPAHGRYFSAAGFCFLLVALNPYSTPFVAEHSVGVKTYWRLTWALPLPLFAAVILERLAAVAILLRPRILAVAACATLAAATLAFGWNTGTLRAANQSTFARPGPKVPAVEAAVVGRILESAGEDATVLVPESVATWVTMHIQHPRLIGVRQAYLSLAFGPAETAHRSNMMRYVAGKYRPPNAETWFPTSLRHHGVTLVVFDHDGRWAGEIESILAVMGWRTLSCGRYVVMASGAEPAKGSAPPRPRCVARAPRPPPLHSPDGGRR